MLLRRAGRRRNLVAAVRWRAAAAELAARTARALQGAVESLWATETTIWSTIERVQPDAADHDRPADR